MTTATTARHARPPAVRRPTRIGWASGLARLAVFLLTHPSAPLPSGLLNVRVPAAPRGLAVTELDGIADAYRTSVARRVGFLVAERSFGPLVVEAHLKDPDYTTQLVVLMDERNEAGNEAAA